MKTRLYPALLFGIVLSIWVQESGSARILAIFPSPTKSHFIMYKPVMEELARRGHHITLASHYSADKEIENINHISLVDTIQIPELTIDELQKMSWRENVNDIIDFSVASCELVMRHPDMIKLVESKQFDLFVTELFGADCFLYVGHKLAVPTIGMISSVTLPWVNDMVAHFENTAYTPMYFIPFVQNMNFFERVQNTFATFYAKIKYEMKSNPLSQKWAEEIFGPLPPMGSVSRNFSLILVNSHFSMNHVKPLVPQMVEVGGLHIPRVIPPLPEDLDKYVKQSPHGVIVFSLGTYTPIESISQEKMQDLIEVLGSLKQNVLWKINASGLPALPPNIRTIMWLPQLSLLCNPATKLFISHGGLLGLQEATYCAVPVIGIPMFADQFMNLAEAQEKGMAIQLLFTDLNKQTLSEAIDKILNNNTYRINAQYLSETFKERPQHPLDTAVYWIEYVLKFNGARHLRSAAHQLAWYQQLLLDVALFFILSLLVTLFILFKLLQVLTASFISIIKTKKDPKKKL